jgi:hypothetical protein
MGQLRKGSSMAVRRRNINDTTSGADEAAPEPTSQARRPEHQFRLQVDRQTKESYETNKAAEQAALAIKKAHPILHVEVVDAGAGVTKVIELAK